MFWTLDLNDTRHIVKPFPGAPQGGMRYLRWAGPRTNFEQEPLALSFISPSQSGTTSALGNGKQNVWTNASEWLDASDAPSSPDTSVSSDTSDSEVEANARSVNPLQYSDVNNADHYTAGRRPPSGQLNSSVTL